jgi:hypothetical protein
MTVVDHGLSGWWASGLSGPVAAPSPPAGRRRNVDLEAQTATLVEQLVEQGQNCDAQRCQAAERTAEHTGLEATRRLAALQEEPTKPGGALCLRYTQAAGAAGRALEAARSAHQSLGARWCVMMPKNPCGTLFLHTLTMHGGAFTERLATGTHHGDAGESGAARRHPVRTAQRRTSASPWQTFVGGDVGSIPTCGALEVWQWTFGPRTVRLVNKSAGQPQFEVASPI